MSFVRRLRLVCAIVLSGVFYGKAHAQFPLPDGNSARSVSGQFIVTPPGRIFAIG
ncbi:MAG: hypothetical protein WDM76_08005 [Limisphaerales bacterium]